MPDAPSLSVQGCPFTFWTTTNIPQSDLKELYLICLTFGILSALSSIYIFFVNVKSDRSSASSSSSSSSSSSPNRHSNGSYSSRYSNAFNSGPVPEAGQVSGPVPFTSTVSHTSPWSKRNFKSAFTVFPRCVVSWMTISDFLVSFFIIHITSCGLSCGLPTTAFDLYPPVATFVTSGLLWGAVMLLLLAIIFRNVHSLVNSAAITNFMSRAHWKSHVAVWPLAFAMASLATVGLNNYSVEISILWVYISFLCAVLTLCLACIISIMFSLRSFLSKFASSRLQSTMEDMSKARIVLWIYYTSPRAILYTWFVGRSILTLRNRTLTNASLTDSGNSSLFSASDFQLDGDGLTSIFISAHGLLNFFAYILGSRAADRYMYRVRNASTFQSAEVYSAASSARTAMASAINTARGNSSSDRTARTAMDALRDRLLEVEEEDYKTQGDKIADLHNASMISEGGLELSVSQDGESVSTYYNNQGMPVGPSSSSASSSSGLDQAPILPGGPASYRSYYSAHLTPPAHLARHQSIEHLNFSAHSHHAGSHHYTSPLSNSGPNNFTFGDEPSSVDSNFTLPSSSFGSHTIGSYRT